MTGKLNCKGSKIRQTKSKQKNNERIMKERHERKKGNQKEIERMKEREKERRKMRKDKY
jgi:hypothetical protein